mmetsp:Transcript_59522/g.88402  ORF Transcript_59522/g.88402 Transcript_59522/m.88402 type:complete len:90 (+) Transcript_59522:1155-1424(+)
MTTDRYPKLRSKTLTNGARILGIAKVRYSISLFTLFHAYHCLEPELFVLENELPNQEINQETNILFIFVCFDSWILVLCQPFAVPFYLF